MDRPGIAEALKEKRTASIETNKAFINLPVLFMTIEIHIFSESSLSELTITEK
jgi:hypothetical protein